MGVKVTNNAFGTLSASINTTDTTITLDSGQGARFPTLGSGDYFFATLIDTSNNLEIVKATARSTDSLTVVRAQDNTTARSFAIGDRFELRPTAALFEAIQDESAVADGDYGDITVSSSGSTYTIDNGAVTDAKMASTLDLSGKTMTYGLDASDMPAGSVVQVVRIQSLGRYNSNAGNGTTLDPLNGTITPKRAGSTFHITGNFWVNTADDSDANNGNVNGYYWGYFQRKVNSGSYATADNRGTSSQGGSQSHVEMSPPRTGNNTTDYWSGNRYRTFSKVTQFFDTPTYSLGDVLTYRFRIYVQSGNFIQLGEPHGNATDDNYNAPPWGFTILEVAQ